MNFLLGEPDLDWVGHTIDLVQRCAGQPWRLALERLDDLQRAEQPTTPRRFTAIVSALQRVTGGRQRNARIAREARGLVLGTPALTPADRAIRIASAAEQLGVTPAELEKLLWSDLPRERAVELPGGRPDDVEVMAFANINLIQRALYRAQAITLHIADDGGTLLRAARQRGLLASAEIGDHGETVIDIVGPLSLFHRTTIYGRALAELAPLLGDLGRFTLEIHVETTDQRRFTTRVVSPVLLPKPPPRLVAHPYPVVRLARQLQSLAPQLVVTPSPPLVFGGTSPGAPILCPDLAIELDGQRWYIELITFWTPDYLARKRAAYATLSAAPVLCIDVSGRSDDADLPSDVLAFHKRLEPGRLLAHLSIATNGAPAGREPGPPLGGDHELSREPGECDNPLQ